jgi:hypothetical protein
MLDNAGCHRDEDKEYIISVINENFDNQDDVVNTIKEFIKSTMHADLAALGTSSQLHSRLTRSNTLAQAHRSVTLGCIDLCRAFGFKNASAEKAGDMLELTTQHPVIQNPATQSCSVEMTHKSTQDITASQ